MLGKLTIVAAATCYCLWTTSSYARDPEPVVGLAKEIPMGSFAHSPLSQIDVGLPATPEGLDSGEQVFRQQSSSGVNLVACAPKEVWWVPSEISHKPLYFDDTPLERYGQSHGHWQPLHSAARFYATFPAIPVKLFTQPPHQAVHALAAPRPGSCAPCLHQKLFR